MLQVEPGRGLSGDEAARRRTEVGRNALREPKQLSGWQILYDRVRSTDVVLLAAVVVAGVLIGEVVEAAAVAVVLVINTIVGFVTELRPVRSMGALRRLTATRARRHLHTLAHPLAWSHWRRRHQHRARQAHYRRRGGPRPATATAVVPRHEACSPPRRPAPGPDRPDRQHPPRVGVL